MNQGQIRQNSACSTSATLAGNNCSPGQYYYVNYGQIVTSNNPADQQSALANLDEPPYSNGAGVGLTIPLFIPLGAAGSCDSGRVERHSSGMPEQCRKLRLRHKHHWQQPYCHYGTSRDLLTLPNRRRFPIRGPFGGPDGFCAEAGLTFL